MVYQMIKIFTIMVTILNAQMVSSLRIRMEISRSFLLNLAVYWKECIEFEIEEEILKICYERKEEKNKNDDIVEYAHQREGRAVRHRTGEADSVCAL